MPPSFFYKYEPLTLQTLSNLFAQIVYFGSPANFNDPYDCALPPIVREYSDEDVAAARTDFISDPCLDPRTGKRLHEMSIDQLRVVLGEVSKNVLATVAGRTIERGVSCFTESNDNLLMWSHYAGRYKGICLEFRGDSPIFTKVRQVLYSDRFPSVCTAGLLLDNREENMIDALLCTKSLEWSYEREWRVIHEKAGTEFRYTSNCLSAIFFGPEIEAEAIELVMHTVKAKGDAIKFWRGKRSHTEFKVLYEEIFPPKNA